MITTEARVQWKKPIEEFKAKVKCCYNCKHWMKDVTLMGDYAYNVCKETNKEPNKTLMTSWDCCCDKYQGVAQEPNYLYTLTTEERGQLNEEREK